LAMKLQEAPIMTRSDWHLHRATRQRHCMR
jgi:hypothetical protein